MALCGNSSTRADYGDALSQVPQSIRFTADKIGNLWRREEFRDESFEQNDDDAEKLGSQGDRRKEGNAKN